MKTLSRIAAALVASATAHACINFNDITLDGKPSEPEGIIVTTRERLLGGDTRESWQAKADKLSRATKGRAMTQAEQSDYAGVLAHLGEYEKARDLLVAAEKMKPGEYSVAANLGTVYELLGQNEAAREWIGEGIKRNSSSHHGSEWLHISILNAKIAMAKDPAWLKTHTVLGSEVDYGTDPRPKDFAPEGRAGRIATLAYQLHERLQFVKAPEPIVGELLFALANEVALMGGVETSIGIYELAFTYKPEQADLLQKRLEFVRQVFAQSGHATRAPVRPGLRPLP